MPRSTDRETTKSTTLDDLADVTNVYFNPPPQAPHGVVYARPPRLAHPRLIARASARLR